MREISKSEIENDNGTAILKLKGNPYDYAQWTSEHYVGYWERGSSTYTSTIKYITYTK